MLFRNIYIGIIILSIFIFGCNKKAEEQATQMPDDEEITSEMIMETTPGQTTISAQPVVSSVTTETLAEPIAEVKTIKTTKEVVKAQSSNSTTTLGFVKPLTKDIQVALQNAGFYKGVIDSKIGPQTKQAIKDFQTKNGLKADGKVGPATWEKLKVYLTTPKTAKSKKAKN